MLNEEEFIKVSLHPPPPLERENLLGLLNRKYQMGVFCQYQNGIVKIIF